MNTSRFQLSFINCTLLNQRKTMNQAQVELNQSILISQQMSFTQKMVEVNLITTTRKYIDLADSNINFLKRVAKQKKEAQHIDITQLNRKIISVTAKLKALTEPELYQWKDIHMIKLRQLATLLKLKSQNPNGLSKSAKTLQIQSLLRQQLHLIVQSCRVMKRKFVRRIVDYNSEEVAEIIQQFYYRQYKDEILEIMEQAGYSINRFRVLQYQQPSFFSFCCCWQPKIR